MKDIKACLTATALLALSATDIAAQPPPSAADRLALAADDMATADRVVVGRVVRVQPVLQRNTFGDELIVSRATVQVEEELRGRGPTTITVLVEGGTLGDLTLSVSDIEPVEPGQRLVFMLATEPSGDFTLHRRGRGALHLDDQDRVEQSGLTLGALRTVARSLGR